MPLRLLHHRSHHQSHAAMTNQQPPTIFFLATNRKTYSRRHHHEPPPRFVPPKSQPLIVAPRFATTISTKPSHCETCRKSQQDHLAITESRVIHRLHRTISKPTSQIAGKHDLSEEEENDMLDYLYTTQYQMGGVVAISLGCAMMTEMNPNGDAAGSGSAVAISAMLMEDEHECCKPRFHVSKKMSTSPSQVIKNLTTLS
ncbi:hypothetical protein LR48_Vigan10g080600 [Vigna angularis]|uniref:Uncharacterized protein n=1 Tax=Phaseolus angularis TaxID=3914 RepID=A0A0L9VJL2_PHAAN|nr:hypothetical protein LR48_Vigan10g080600 [Vigna angularis]